MSQLDLVRDEICEKEREEIGHRNTLATKNKHAKCDEYSVWTRIIAKCQPTSPSGNSEQNHIPKILSAKSNPVFWNCSSLQYSFLYVYSLIINHFCPIFMLEYQL